jgi:hypothetical protein
MRLDQNICTQLPLGGSGLLAAGEVVVATINTTQASTDADLTEKTLWTYDLPANTLNVNLKAVRLTIIGQTGATANTKNIRVYFGSQVLILFTTVLNSGSWRIVGDILRTGPATELAEMGRLDGSGAAAAASNFALTQDTTAPITIKVTGQNGTAAAGDITFRAAIVEVLN